MNRIRLCNHGDRHHLRSNQLLSDFSLPYNLNFLLSLYFSFWDVFPCLYMIDVLFICHLPNVLNAWSLYLDNEHSVVPECVAEDIPEQQPGEGKCPLTHYVTFIYNSLSRITLFKPKDWLVCIYLILVYLLCLYCSVKLVFTWLYMFGVLFICLYPNVLNAWSLYLENKQPVVSKCVAEDLPEQQPSEWKCPLAHYVWLTL